MKKTIKGKGRRIEIYVNGEREFYSEVPKFQEKENVKIDIIIE